MTKPRFPSNWQFSVLFLTLLSLHGSFCSPQRSSSIQGRYIRPSTQDRDDPKCTGRCSDSSDRGRDDYRDDGYRVGGTSDYKPKDDRRTDDYIPKPKDDYGSGAVDYDRDRPSSSRDDYKPKPPVRVNHNSKPVDRDDLPIRDDSEPKPAVIDDYKPKPPVRVDYKPRPVRHDYDTKPVVRDDYESKPAIRDEYKPKPPIRDDDYDTKPVVVDGYKPKPPVRDDDYDTKPVVGGGYKPPVRDDDYDTKPVVGDGYKPPVRGDDYDTRPVVVGGYKPPVRDDDYDTKPVVGGGYKPPVRDDDYDTKPVVGDGYKPPVRDDDYDTKPVVSSGYKPPVRGDDYDTKPAVSGGYKPPVRSDDYDTRPVVSGGYKPPVRDDYDAKPVASGGYKPPVRDDDDYDTKPVISGGYKPPVRDDYDTKPVTGGGYKPPVRDEYDTKPVTGGGYKPPVRDEYDTKPVTGGEYKPPARDDYDTKPATGGGYKPPARDDYSGNPREDHAPKPPVRDSYRPSSGGGYQSGYPVKKEDDYKVPGGGYDNSKGGDDYNDDYKGGEEVDGRPVPVADDSNCVCVPYYQCTDGHIVTDGAGIIDARRRQSYDDELPLDGKFKPPSCGPFHVCCNTPESSTVKPYEHRCGVRNPSGINSRILSPSNKGEADFGEWPWQAAVLKAEGTVNIFQCGGVLIDKYHVLTVAHCVFHLYKYNNYPLKVRLGEWDTQTTSEFLAHDDYKVSKITIHPEFKNTSLWNDVAILRLQDPVLFAPHIDTVCLPKYDENFAGQNCVVTGWGKDSYKGGTFSNVMKEVALQVTDNYNCEEMLRKTRLGRFFQLHEGFVCAGGEHGLDSCKGDGGGPLVCYRKDRSYALAGLVSWGIDCGQPGVPGVYVKVQKYLDWISKNTGVDLEEYWPKH